MSKLDSLWQMM